jgi:hypothetical protein
MTIKKVFQFAHHLLLIPVLILAGCGGKKDICKLSPDKITIGGVLAEYIQVEENTYTLTKLKNTYHLAIKIKAIKPLDPSVAEKNNYYINANLLDNSGSPLSGNSELISGYNGLSTISSLLISGSGEAVITLFSNGDFSYDDAGKFSLSSTSEVKQERSNSNPPAESVQEVTQTNTESSGEGSLTLSDVEEFIYKSDYKIGPIYLDFKAGGVVKKCYKSNKDEFGTDYEDGTWSIENGNIKISNLGKYDGLYTPRKSNNGFNVGEVLDNIDPDKSDFYCVDYW